MEKMTVPRFQALKGRSDKIVSLTACDWNMASILDSLGLELILVGDSAGMVFAGHPHTLPVTMDQMIYHTQCVSRGVRSALIIADMPFLSYQTGPADALFNAGRFLKEAGADGVKIEGGRAVADTVRRMTEAGIPVMGHLGLTPQSIRIFGGYGVRCGSPAEAARLKEDAKALEQAGAFSMVLEKIPADLAREVTESLGIPTIGIGAGPHCDGQILVTHDLLGLFESFKPRFARQYASLGKIIREAVTAYVKDVKSGQFPSKEESY